MPEPRGARSIIENAEQAAAAGDYASAEDLLRKAVALQEQTLGPNHPDLANTLNNLGVVCEMADNPIDAEHYFRRAYAIATATLPPDHPFIATSRKNLHDFCAARGVAAVTSAARALAGSACAAHSANGRVVATEDARRDTACSQEILAPARTCRIERRGPADYRFPDVPALGPWARRGEVASGDGDRSSARASGADAHASGNRTNRATATDRNTHAAHSQRGRPGQRRAQHAHHGIGRDVNRGHGAALHRPPDVAMRGSGQRGSPRPNVFLHAGQIRNRHHD